MSSKTRNPLFWCMKSKNKYFAWAKTHFFVIPHVMYWWSWHSLLDDLATDLDFNMLCIDEFGTTCKTPLQRTFTCIEQLTKTKDRHSYKYMMLKPKKLIALPADIFWLIFFLETSLFTQRRVYLPSKFTWTLTHVPPHPTHVYTHITAHTETSPLT